MMLGGVEPSRSGWRSWVVGAWPSMENGVRVFWLPGLLLVPLAAVLACRPLLMRWLDGVPAKAQAEATVDYLSFRKKLALSYSPYRATIWVCAYAGLVSATCAAGAWASGGVRIEHDGSYWHVYLERRDLFAVMLPPALALLIASLGALLAGANYGGALRGTGLFAVIWLAAGAIGCLFTSIGVYTSSGPHLLPIGGTLAFVAAVWLLVPRPGGSTFSRAQRALAESEVRFAAQALRDLPRQGEYEAPYTRGIWGRLQSVFFVPSTVVRSARWDEGGLQVQWLQGEPTRYSWEGLRSLSTLGRGADVTTSDGRRVEFPDTGRNYRELLSALRAHIWAREPQQDQGDHA